MRRPPVYRLVAAEWLRMGRHWLSWALLVLLIVTLTLQVNGKLPNFRPN